MALSSHQVFALLALIACFVSSSLALLVLECEFLTFIFMILYAGAIIVLFLFSVMMLELKFQDLLKKKMLYLSAGTLLVFIFIGPYIESVFTFFNLQSFRCKLVNFSMYNNEYFSTDNSCDVEAYNKVLYYSYTLPLLISGLILLSILVGVTYLTHDYKKKHSKYQAIYKQLSKNIFK